MKQKNEHLNITIHVTEKEADKIFCGKFPFSEWLEGGKEGYGDHFNPQAVVILTKAVKLLLKNNKGLADKLKEARKPYVSPF
jgi:hypothetical protein